MTGGIFPRCHALAQAWEGATREDGRVNVIVREKGIFMSFDWAGGTFAQGAAATGLWS